MHLIEYIMHTSGFSKLKRHFGLCFALGSVQLHFIIHILGLDWLGSSSPVNWKQSSFVGLLISNNGYQSILMITVINFKNLPGDTKKYSCWSSVKCTTEEEFSNMKYV